MCIYVYMCIYIYIYMYICIYICMYVCVCVCVLMCVCMYGFARLCVCVCVCMCVRVRVFVCLCVYNYIRLDSVPLVYLRMLHFQSTDQSVQSFSGLVGSVHVGWDVAFSGTLVGSGVFPVYIVHINMSCVC